MDQSRTHEKNSKAKPDHKHRLEDTKQICPMCNSDNVVLWLGGTTGTYRCVDCGYVGPLVIETDLENSGSPNRQN